RMRVSRGAQHKALVPILGVPMLERNVVWLLARGFRNLHIAISESERTLRDFVETRCEALTRSFGARLNVIIEESPLGTIGACRICPVDGDLVVVNVDNLTSLNLKDMLESHRRNEAAMTIATHQHTFRMPFGQVRLEDCVVADM